MEEKRYIVPPDLGAKFMVLGMQLGELFVTGFPAPIAVFAAAHGVWELLLIPATLALLFVRMAGPTEPNVLGKLKTRLGFFMSVQKYSLNPLGR